MVRTIIVAGSLSFLGAVLMAQATGRSVPPSSGNPIAARAATGVTD